jgi:hypothetical protein
MLICFVAGPRDVEPRYVEIEVTPSALSPARQP